MTDSDSITPTHHAELRRLMAAAGLDRHGGQALLARLTGYRADTVNAWFRCGGPHARRPGPIVFAYLRLLGLLPARLRARLYEDAGGG